MPRIYVEGKPYTVRDGQNLLHAVLSLGFNLEYFCWHPALNSVGACRQCAVMQYKDEEAEKAGRGRLSMACMTPAADGTRISITAPGAIAFRRSVIEWLMVNHPHDCPVCDEGGECHLQDMTQMAGHNYREYRFKKRTHRNQNLGPFIAHEMNRCIACYRCVRYYRDFAGGTDLDVFGVHDAVYFGRREDGVLESEFAGNLVEICPTGVFTDKTLAKHYTRKWDLISAPSVCHHCSVGCNTIVGTRYGEPRRIINRHNHDVNGYFICDRGRFGYEFMQSESIIRQPRIAGVDSSIRDAVIQAAELIRSGTVIGIGSPRASLEANYALRELVGKDCFYSGMDAAEHDVASRVLEILRTGPARSATLHDVEQADAVLILGEDLTNYAPMLDFAVRQAARNQPIQKVVQLGIARWNENPIREAIQDDKGAVFVVTPAPCKLDGAARESIRLAPDDIARFGFALAHALDNDAPDPRNLSEPIRSFVARVAREFRSAQRPVIISGSGLRNVAIVEAAASVAWALRKVGVPGDLACALSECNSLGAAFADGANVRALFADSAKDSIDTVIVLENDLYRCADSATIERLFGRARHIIAVDHLETTTTARADVVLPAATYAASDGTLINFEGRAQRFFQAVPPRLAIQESWRWIRDIMQVLNRPEAATWTFLDAISRATYLGLPKIGFEFQSAPDATYRVIHQRIPRAPHRYSGRTAEDANWTVHEPKPPDDPDTPLAFSMEGYQGKPPSPALIPFFWTPGWNSVQATMRYQQEVGGQLKGGDPGVRLIEPISDSRPAYVSATPDPFTPRTNEWLIVPLYHIYGSEPMSSAAPSVGTLAPAPYFAISPGDTHRLGLSEGEAATITLNGVEHELPARILKGLTDGIIGIPSGLIGLGPIFGAAWTTIIAGVRR